MAIICPICDCPVFNNEYLSIVPSADLKSYTISHRYADSHSESCNEDGFTGLRFEHPDFNK